MISDKQVPLKKSIATQILWVVLGLYLLIASAVVLGQLWVSYRYQQANIARELVDFEGAFGNGLAVSLWNLDEEALRAAVEGMLATPTIVGVIITNDKKETVATGGEISRQGQAGNVGLHIQLSGCSDEEKVIHDNDYAKYKMFEHQFPLTYTDHDKRIYLGRATLFSSSAVIYQRMTVEIVMVVVTVGITLLTFFLALYWAINRYLRRPLGILTNATAGISMDNLGTFSVDTKTTAGNEIKRLEETITSMVLDLHHAISKQEESEKNFRAMIETLPLAIYLSSELKQVCEYINPTFTSLLGYSIEDVPDADHWFLRAYPDETYRDQIVAEWIKRIEKAIEAKSRLEPMEAEVTCKDGSTKTILWGYISTGHKNYAYGLDLTRRKKAEESLRESESTFRKLFEDSSDPILLIDQSVVFVECNQAALDLLKMTREQFILQPPANISPKYQPDGRQSDVAAVEMIALAYQKGLHRFDWTCLNSIGEEFIVEVSLMPISVKGQTMLHTTWRDITDRKKAEEVIKRRVAALTQPKLNNDRSIALDELFNIDDIQRLQDEFAKATGVASIITHIDGRPITAPSNFCRLCNGIIRKTDKGCANCYKSDAALGKYHIGGPIIQPCLSGGLWDAGAGISVGGKHIANWLIGQVCDETQTENEMRAYAREIEADEESFIAAFREVPTMPRERFDSIAKMLYTFANQLSTLAYQNLQQARFITERKQAEEERLSLERQVQHAQKLESLGVLAGGIAHDFNNILMAILGNADLALDQLAPHAPARENIEEIERASRRAADLARQMLAYSGKGRFVIEPINLNAFVEEMIHLLEVSISKKAVLKLNYADNLPVFDGDATQIRQIIMNLITNASEAIGEKSGVIALSTGTMTCDRAYLQDARVQDDLPEGLYVYIEVSDTGCGMDKETVGKIFDPFYTTKFTGRGLGLSAVLGIVRGHKGVIKIYSEVGKGTTFIILFPASEVPGTAAVKKLIETEKVTWQGEGTILLADDEEAVCAVGKRMLERLGFSVLTASHGREAVDIFREHSEEIVCVLLDLTMPQMDGEEAFREILRIRPEARVVLCSGYNIHDATQRFTGYGLASFLQKPYNVAALRETLRIILHEQITDS